MTVDYQYINFNFEILDGGENILCSDDVILFHFWYDHEIGCS